MARGIDHLVLCVNDLKNARTLYERLGFTLTPDAQHPFGTGNVIAQLDGSFLEILSVTRPDDIPADRDGHFNFADFNRGFLKEREGMSMLVMESDDAENDHAAYVDAGLHVYAPFQFQRQQTLPDGSTATVGFSLTFTDDPASLPNMGFFTCQQWRPDLFWKPEYKQHANSAAKISDVFIVTPEPTNAIPFLQSFVGQVPASDSSEPLTFVTPRGRIQVMTTKTFDQQFPGALSQMPEMTSGFAGYAVSVSDLDEVRAKLSAEEIPFLEAENTLWLAPDTGAGCVIAFKA